MHPSRIFENYLIDNPEVCNYCFRKKADLEDFDSLSFPRERLPDYVIPRLSPTESSEKLYPPPVTDGRGQIVELDYYYKSSGGYSSRAGLGGEGRNEPIEPQLSKPTIVCDCGWVDDQVIDGYPFDDRPAEKLEEVGKRVYHRLDEQGIEVDYDVLEASLHKRKTSDEYEYGDFEVLKDSVSDSVRVTQ